MTTRIDIYRKSTPAAALCQGEILSNVIIHRINAASLSEADLKVDKIPVPFAVILSADCDLERDFDLRASISELQQRIESSNDQSVKEGLASEIRAVLKNTLTSILLCRAWDFEISKAEFPGEWRPLVQNQHERYHFLCEAESAEDLEGTGIPALLIDFRRYVAVPSEELYKKLNGTATDPAVHAKRRTCLLPPFLQDLSSRFGNYLSRVGLEKNHWDLSALSESKELSERLDDAKSSVNIEDAKKDLGL